VLTDQQGLALASEQYGHGAKQDADRERSDSIDPRLAPSNRCPGADKDNGDADEGSGIFEKNDELRRIFARPDCGQVAVIAKDSSWAAMASSRRIRPAA
jgi:hypothetical protein